MFEIITDWLTGRFAKPSWELHCPTVSALVVGLGVLGMTFVFMLLSPCRFPV